MEDMEKSISPEGEKGIETKVILEFMRHSEKESDKTKTDEEVRLTEKGRKMAQERGESLEPQKEVSLAWGSPKQRTQETALHVMLPEIDENTTLEEMKEIIAREQKIGGKIKEDLRLNFDVSGPEGEELMEAAKAGEYLQYLFEKSDQRAIELKDRMSSSYTRYAGNIAEIVSRYTKVGNNFNRIASQKEDYEEFGNQLERYLTTHQGVVEGFLAKVLEEKEGVEKRDEFIKAVGGGFKELHGIHVEIVNNGSEQKIRIDYSMNGEAQSVEIDRELLEKIIKDRADFEERIDPKENEE